MRYRTDVGIGHPELERRALIERSRDHVCESWSAACVEARIEWETMQTAGAIHGGHLEFVEHNDELAVNLPTLDTPAVVSEWALRQLCLFLNYPIAGVLGLSARVAAIVLNDMCTWAFDGAATSAGAQARYLLPMLDLYQSARPLLRGVPASTWNRYYDHELLDGIEPYLGDIEAVRITRGERHMLVWLVNKSRSWEFGGQTWHPALVVQNSEVGARMAVIQRLAYRPDGGVFVAWGWEGNCRAELCAAKTHANLGRFMDRFVKPAIAFLRQQQDFEEELGAMRSASQRVITNPVETIQKAWWDSRIPGSPRLGVDDWRTITQAGGWSKHSQKTTPLKLSIAGWHHTAHSPFEELKQHAQRILCKLW